MFSSLQKSLPQKSQKNMFTLTLLRAIGSSVFINVNICIYVYIMKVWRKGDYEYHVNNHVQVGCTLILTYLFCLAWSFRHIHTLNLAWPSFKFVKVSDCPCPKKLYTSTPSDNTCGLEQTLLHWLLRKETFSFETDSRSKNS